MNPGIFYLYEYDHTKKIRTVGFLKLTRYYHSCTLQLNARGIPVTRADTLKLCAFYLEDHAVGSTTLAELPCADHMLSARLNFAECQFPDGHTLNTMDGFFLPLPGGRILAATVPGILVDGQKLMSAFTKPAEPAAADTDSADEEPAERDLISIDEESADGDPISMDEEPAKRDLISAGEESSEPDPISMDKESSDDDTLSMDEKSAGPDLDSTDEAHANDDPLPMGEEPANDDPISTSEAPAEPAPISTEEALAKSDPISTCEAPAEPDSISTKDEPADNDPISTCEAPAEPADGNPISAHKAPALETQDIHCDPDDSIPEAEQGPTAEQAAPCCNDGSETQTPKTTQKKVRKIQRSDMAELPRHYWHLANNSFLLHGYHNYSHLLLVEEDGHHWLGVPGIYDSREARAARLFGFPQFTDSYNEHLELSDDEKGHQGNYGYWCCYLK